MNQQACFFIIEIVYLNTRCTAFFHRLRQVFVGVLRTVDQRSPHADVFQMPSELKKSPGARPGLQVHLQ